MSEPPAYGTYSSTNEMANSGDKAASSYSEVRSMERCSHEDVMVYNAPDEPPMQPPPPYPLNIPDEPPPSYDSLFGRAKAAKQESSGPGDFIKKFLEMACIACLGTVGCAIVYGLFLALPIAMIILGARYVSDCPAERYIPIYLIVGGSSWILWQVYVWKPWKKKKKTKSARNSNESLDGDGDAETGNNTNAPVMNTAAAVQPTAPGLEATKNCNTNSTDPTSTEPPKEKEDDSVTCSETTLLCFILAWFIAGNVWVYRTATEWQGIEPQNDDYCNPVLYYFSFWLITGTYILLFLILTCMSAVNLCS